jgi:hypothetical protein
MERVEIMDERVLNVAFQKPLQITRRVGEDAFQSDKAAGYKMVN